MSAADGARVGGRAARPAAAVALLLAGPFAAACALGAALAAQGVVARNAYRELGLEHAAAELLQAAVDRGVLLALCAALPLVCLALLARATRRRLALVTAWALGLELVLVVPLAALALGWGGRRWRFGHELPDLLWSAERGRWALAALLVPLAALLVAVRRTRGRADSDVALPGPRLARAAAACLALALAAPLAVHAFVLAAPPRAAARRPHVVYVTWDSVRADRVSAYGSARETTPNLDRLAAAGVLFEQAFSQNNWTRPSYMSILTSRYRWELDEGDWSRAVTLGELLKDAGYCTLAVVQNPNLDRSLGFDQGFDAYVEINEREPIDALLAVLARRVPRLARGGRPLFLFLHVQEPHWPYRGDDRDAARFLAAGSPPIGEGEVTRLMRTNGAGWDPAAPDAAAKVGRMLDLYDLDIHLADRALGGIEALLDAHGLWEESLVVFNSDHGDEFADHDAFGHAHHNVHPELTRVPFVLRFPAALGVAPARVADVVRNLDLMPTVLAVLGIESPAALSGRSLWPLSGSPEEELALSYAGGVVALRDGAHALLVDYDREPPEPRFYDRAADPMERAPLAERPDAFERFALRAAAWSPDHERAVAGSAPEAGTQELDPELRKRLEALGYL